jgi:hypothetical protein
MQIERNQRAIRLLDSWDRDQDEAKQIEDLADLKRSLDENRTGQRKLFS